MAPGARPDLKVLAFDVFGTFVDWRGGVAAEMAAIVKERQLTVDASAFADGWRSKYLPYLSRIRSGEMPWQVLDGVHRASLRELISELSLQGLTEADLDRLVFAWHHLPPWPGPSPPPFHPPHLYGCMTKRLLGRGTTGSREVP